eukprot:gene12811-27014_t
MIWVVPIFLLLLFCFLNSHLTFLCCRPDLQKFFASVVPEHLNHTGSHSFDSHLRGVQAVLRHWNADTHVSDAGLFHSIYGTEGFQGHKLALSFRPSLRSLIGERAERLAWIFCMVDRYSVDQTVFAVANDPAMNLDNISFTSRVELGRFPIPLRDEKEWLDFIELTLADWLEQACVYAPLRDMLHSYIHKDILVVQVEGAALKENVFLNWQQGEAWSYRREAYRHMAEVLASKNPSRLHVALQMHKEVYAQESAATRHLHQPLTAPVSEAARDAREAMASVHY